MEKEEFKVKYEEIIKREQSKIDKFDFFMLKYGSWIRIGENRVYIKKTIDTFRFLVLFDPDICLAFPMVQIENDLVPKGKEISLLSSIEYTGELLILPLSDIDKFTNACIYAMAGAFTQDARKIGMDNNREELYMSLRKEDKNENPPCDHFTIK